MQPTWKPPAQFDFSTPGADEAPDSWEPPAQFDFSDAPTSADTTSVDGQEQGGFSHLLNAIKPATQYASDLGNTFMAGAAGVGRSLGWLTKQNPFNPANRALGEKLEEISTESQQHWLDNISDEFEAKANAGLDDPEFGVTTLVSAATRSLPEMMLTAGGAGLGAKLAQVGMKVGMPAVAAAAANGSVLASRVMRYSRYAPAVGGALAGGAAEGTLAAGAVGVAMEDHVAGLTHEQLIEGSDRYRAVYEAAEGMQEDNRQAYAKRTIAEELARETAAWVGITTAGLGAPMGGLFGHLATRGVSGAAIGGAIGKLEGKVLGQAALGAAGEGGQEFLQEGAQQFLTNMGIREYANKNQELDQGVIESAVMGGLVGGLMGGVIAPVTGAGQRVNSKAKQADPAAAAAEPPVKFSRNPILEARITQQLQSLETAGVPAAEFNKVARWNQESGGRSALEFSKALEELIETGMAPEPIAIATGDDFDGDGLLTQRAYEKDAKRYAFDVEMRIKPADDAQRAEVAAALGEEGANPYVMDDGTFVVPQSKAGADGLRAVGKSLERKLKGVAITYQEKADESAKPAVSESAAAKADASAEATVDPETEGLLSDDASVKMDLPGSTDAEKLQAIHKLTEENQPIIDAFLAEIDGGVPGTTSKSSVKLDETIIGKAHRPSILAEKPWHTIEHVRDTLRFKSEITSVKDIVPIAEKLAKQGWEVVKVDTEKLMQPKEWGWRFVGVDLRMPNGQLVEYYLPLKSLSQVKKQNHKLFEKWRNEDVTKLTAEQLLERKADIEASRASYDAAFAEGTQDLDESALRASLSSFAASLGSTNVKSLKDSSVGKTKPETQAPSLNEAAQPSSSMTSTRLRSSEAITSADISESPNEAGGTETVAQVDTPRKSVTVTDAAGIEEMGRTAASHPDNDLAEPTERQLAAGNYPKGHGTLKGAEPREDVKVSIENVPGSIRRGLGGSKWSRKMKHHYGYVRGTPHIGDGKLDVYIGRNAHDNTLPVFVVRQMDTDGNFDEPKVVMGYATEGEAKNAYLSEYPPHLGPKLFGGITRMTRAQFADYIESGDTDVPPNPITKAPMLSLRRTRKETDERVEETAAEAAAKVEAKPRAADKARIAGVPRFAQGKVKQNAVSVIGVHYSNEAGLQSLDPAMAGSGSAGGERRRFGMGTYGKKMPAGSIGRRLYFYEQVGNALPQKESAVTGEHAYRVQLDNVYDIGADPDGIIADLIEENGPAVENNTDMIEEAINDAGYDGFIAQPAPGMRSRPIVLFGLTKEVPVAPAGKTSAERPATMKAMLQLPQVMLRKPGWAVVTASREAAGDPTALPNVLANKRLRSQLIRDGIPFMEVKGSYKGVDQGINFMVFTDEDTAVQLGRDYGQESILTNRGLVYSDGRLTPVDFKASKFGKAAQSEDFYSTLPNGWTFSLGLDFDATTEAPLLRLRKKAIPEIVTSSGLLRSLTPAELEKVTERIAEKIVANLEKLPPADEIAAVAHAGRAKRGWYRQSAEAISGVFGADAPRFAALLAAMSPQTSVTSNLRNALNTWANWVEAGRPTDREAIIDIMAASVEGGGGRASVLGAWINNSVRALTTEDPEQIMLSGPKVNSFMHNLRGDVNEVTNDAWMANFAAVNQTMFRGALTKSDPGKRPGYLSMSARIREAANILTEMTGETWTPAEVQETVWSWSKTIFEAADSQFEFRSAEELVMDRALTDEMIRGTPDFGSMFTHGEFADILVEAGYAEQIEQVRRRYDAAQAAYAERAAAAEAAPFAAEAQVEYERRAARRLDAVRRQDVEVTDEVPFSLRERAFEPADERLARVRQVVDAVAATITGAPEYSVVQDASELPKHSRAMIASMGVEGLVEGMYDPVTGRVFIVADNIEVREGETLETAVERVFAEETLGHFGLRAVFGEDAMNVLLDQVWRDFQNDPRMRDVIEDYEAYGSTEDQAVQRRLADEYLAKIDPNSKPTLWKRVIAWAREQLRNLGYVREWTDNDIKVLMDRVFSAVRNGETPTSLERLERSLVTVEGLSPTVRMGSRTTRYNDGDRDIDDADYSAEVGDGEIDGVPAAEVYRFAGNLRSLASFLAEEGKQRIVLPQDAITEEELRESEMPFDRRDGTFVVTINDVAPNATPSFSLRNRKRGSDDVEAILSKTIQMHEAEMTYGQRMNQWFRELTGYFGNADTWLELKTAWIDSAAAIEKLERGQFSGKLLDAAESAYKMISLVKNLPQLMAAVSKVGVPQYKDGAFVKVPGRKGLYEIFQPLFKTNDGKNLLHLWEGYAVARRSSQLIQQTNPDGTSKEKLLAPNEIDKLLQLEKEYPIFRKVFDEWQQFNRDLLNLAVDRGALDRETADLWMQNDYVPFFRVEESEDVAAGITRKRGLSGQRVTSKRLTGSDKRIQPVLENIVMNSAAILEKVYKNEAMTRIVALADGIAMEREPLRTEAVKISNDQIARQLAKAGLKIDQLTPEQLEQWTTFFRRVRPEGPNVVSVMVGGKPVYYRVHDPLVLRAIMDMTPTNFGALVDFMGGAKRLLTSMVTLDPGFMAANWMRDTLSSWVASGEKFRPFRDAPKGIAEVWMDNGLATDLALAGGMTGGFYNPTQDFADVMHEIHGATVLNSPKKLLDTYRKVGMVSEQVNRIAIARAVLRRGGSIAEAAYQAQDILNFTQSGDAVAAQLLIRTVPFLNARIQGLYRLWKGATGKGGGGVEPAQARMGFFIKGLMLAGVSLALAAANMDDERYEKLPDVQKDTYWHFFVGSQHYAIPKPFEVGVLSATLPERAFRLIAGRDSGKTVARSVQRAVMDTFAFNPTPQLFKPVIEQWANRSFFSGRPIVGLELEGLEPQAQYNPWTSETARAISTMVDQVVPDSLNRFGPLGALRSPVRVEHAMRAYLGTMGGYLLQLSDAALRGVGAYPEGPDMASIRDVPAVGGAVARFVRGDPELQGSSKYADDLYDALQDADDAYRTLHAYVNRNELEKAQALTERRYNMLTVRPVLNEFKEQASAINRMQRLVMASDLPPDQKREKLDELTRTKNKLMKQAVPYLGMIE